MSALMNPYHRVRSSSAPASCVFDFFFLLEILILELLPFRVVYSLRSFSSSLFSGFWVPTPLPHLFTGSQFRPFLVLVLIYLNKHRQRKSLASMKQFSSTDSSALMPCHETTALQFSSLIARLLSSLEWIRVVYGRTVHRLSEWMSRHMKAYFRNCAPFVIARVLTIRSLELADLNRAISLSFMIPFAPIAGPRQSAFSLDC